MQDYERMHAAAQAWCSALSAGHDPTQASGAGACHDAGDECMGSAPTAQEHCIAPPPPRHAQHAEVSSLDPAQHLQMRILNMTMRALHAV